MDRSDSHSTPLRYPKHVNAHVRPRGNCRALGPPDASSPRNTVGNRRVHGIRATWLRASEHAALPSGPSEIRPNVERTSEGSRPGAYRASRIDQQPSGFVGEIKS